MQTDRCRFFRLTISRTRNESLNHTNNHRMMEAKLLKRNPGRFAKLHSRWLPTPNVNPETTPTPPTRSPPMRIPVFMLPRRDLATIQEDEEIHEGFFVRVSVGPHLDREFWGLMSLSECHRFLEQSEATSVKYRSFSCHIADDIDARRRNTILSQTKQAIRQQSKQATNPRQ